MTIAMSITISNKIENINPLSAPSPLERAGVRKTFKK